MGTVLISFGLQRPREDVLLPFRTRNEGNKENRSRKDKNLLNYPGSFCRKEHDNVCTSIFRRCRHSERNIGIECRELC